MSYSIPEHLLVSLEKEVDFMLSQGINQRLMDQVLYVLSEFSCAYIDDIIIYSKMWEEHVENLKVVFDCLHSACLTINPAKCVLAKKETKYQGFTRVWRWVN